MPLFFALCVRTLSTFRCSITSSFDQRTQLKHRIASLHSLNSDTVKRQHNTLATWRRSITKILPPFAPGKVREKALLLGLASDGCFVS